MSFGGPPDEVHQDKRTAAAMALAKKAISNPHKITDEDFKELNLLFNLEEISALCSFIAFVSGANKFGIITGLSTKDLK
jgi:alkylhydroperoxidase family enzyme